MHSGVGYLEGMLADRGRCECVGMRWLQALRGLPWWGGTVVGRAGVEGWL